MEGNNDTGYGGSGVYDADPKAAEWCGVGIMFPHLISEIDTVFTVEANSG